MAYEITKHTIKALEIALSEMEVHGRRAEVCKSALYMACETICNVSDKCPKDVDENTVCRKDMNGDSCEKISCWGEYLYRKALDEYNAAEEKFKNETYNDDTG